jgi:hydrogenase/urease accessory protein HupE
MTRERAARPSAEVALALLLLLAAVPVYAHEQTGQAAGFLTGPW